MPTYEYACTACGHDFEAVQSFSDDPLTQCPECGGTLRKLFGNVGVVFKGSGFYRNDSRSSGAGTADSGASTSGASTDAGSSTSSSTSSSSSTSTSSSTSSSNSSSSSSKQSTSASTSTS